MRVFALPCLLLLALYTPTARAADCMAASHAADVGDRLKAAEVALQAGDPDGFQGALEEVTLLLPCLADALPPDVSAELHRLVGVQMFTSGKTDAATPAFLASRVLEPSYHFPESEFSADHAIRKAYEGLSSGVGKDKKAPEPRTGSIAFDGTASRERPADRNTVVQLLNASDQVTQTSYLLPDQPLPAYPAVPHLRNSLLLTTAVAIAGSAACYGGAWAAHGQFESPDPTYTLTKLRGFQTTANVLFGASITLGALGVGTGTSAALVGAR